MILQFLRRRAVKREQVTLGRQQNKRAIRLLRHCQRETPHMVARFRQLFRQHHKRAALDQLILRHPTRKIFMSFQPARERQPLGADFSLRRVELLAHVRAQAGDMNMKWFCVRPVGELIVSEMALSGTSDPRFRVIKLRDCHASQKKFGV